MRLPVYPRAVHPSKRSMGAGFYILASLFLTSIIDLSSAIAGAGHCETVELLLSNGADPNAMSQPHQIVPLCMAAAGLHRQVAELLLQAGALSTLVDESTRPVPSSTAPEAAHSPAEEGEDEGKPTKSGFHLNPLRAHKLVIDIIPNYEEELCDTLSSARISTPLAQLLEDQQLSPAQH